MVEVRPPVSPPAAPRPVLYYIQVLSLDICVGVIGSGAFAKTLLKATMKPVWWFLLPASVWVIYTADHLMDARKVGKNAVNIRHKFHADHFKPLALLMVTAALVCAILAFFYLREIVFAGGIVMGLLALFHVLVAYWGKIRFGKEISVAVIYSCGVWFGPFLNRGLEPTLVHIAAFLLFMLAALLNLFMNSVLEFAIDRAENQVFGMRMGSEKWMKRTVVAVSLLATTGSLLFCLMVQMDRYFKAYYSYLMVLCAVPGIILFFDFFFLKNQRYRLPAEWIFATGLAFLWMPA